MLLFFMWCRLPPPCSLLLNALYRTHSTAAGSEEGRAKGGGRRYCASRVRRRFAVVAMRRRDASAVHRVPRRRDGRIGGSPLSSCARRDARIGGSPSSSCAVASVGGSPPSSSCRGRGGPLLLLFQLQGCFLLFFFAVSPDLTCSLLLNALHRNHSTAAGSEEGRAKSGGRRRCVSRGSPSLCVAR